VAKKANCIVTYSIEGKGAYAITVESDESVYIPVGVTEAAELEEFDELEAILVKNDRAEPAWKAIKVRRLTDDA
jgi:hypothetical protein